MIPHHHTIPTHSTNSNGSNTVRARQTMSANIQHQAPASNFHHSSFSMQNNMGYTNHTDLPHNMSILSASSIAPDISFNFDQLLNDAQRCELAVNRNATFDIPFQDHVPTFTRQSYLNYNNSITGTQQLYSRYPTDPSYQPHNQINSSMAYNQPFSTQWCHQSAINDSNIYNQPHNIPLSHLQQQYYSSSSSMETDDNNKTISSQHMHMEETTENQSNNSGSKQGKDNTQEFKLSSNRTDSKISTEAVKREVEEKFQTECTFKPQITKYTSNKKEMPREERLKRLTDDKKAMYEKREQERKRREEEEMQQYKFHPNIEKRNGGKQSDLSKTQSVTERLLKDAANKTMKREQAKREQEIAEFKKHHFAPKTNKNALPENYVPVHERIYELQRQREEKMRDLRLQQVYGDSDLKFNPEINKTSEMIARVRNRHGLNFYERVQMGISKSSSNKRRKIQIPSDEVKHCTFHPSVNPKSEQLLQNSRLYSEETDFVKRQEILNMREQKKKELIKEKENVNHQSTFKPSINQKSQIIAESLPSRIGETEEEKLERLARKDLNKKEALHTLIQEQYYSQFSFQPQLNSTSKAIGQASNVADYKLHEQLKQHRLSMIPVEKFDFKPKLVAKAGEQVQAKVFDPDYENRLNRKLDCAHKVQEYNELKECTFQPQIIKKVPEQPPGPVIIKGLGNHLERFDKAKRIEEERREAEEQAFKVKLPGYLPSGFGFTIPEPFERLHPDNNERIREMKRLELVNKAREQEMLNCTFQPKLNHSSVDVGLSSLLGSL